MVGTSEQLLTPPASAVENLPGDILEGGLTRLGVVVTEPASPPLAVRQLAKVVLAVPAQVPICVTALNIFPSDAKLLSDPAFTTSPIGAV